MRSLAADLSTDEAEYLGVVGRWCEDVVEPLVGAFEAGELLVTELDEQLHGLDLLSLGLAAAPRGDPLASVAAALALLHRIAQTHAALAVRVAHVYCAQRIVASTSFASDIRVADATVAFLRDQSLCPCTLDGIVDPFELATSAEAAIVLHTGEAIVVLAQPFDPQLSVSAAERRSGLRGLVARRAAFSGYRIPERAVTADVNLATRQVALYCLTTAAILSGVAGRAMRLASQYARERWQFGKPIASLPAVAGMLEDSQLSLDALDDLIGASARSAAIGSDGSAEPIVVAEHAAATCLRVVLDAVQVHGGYGYVSEFGIDRRVRDVMSLGARARIPRAMKVTR